MGGSLAQKSDGDKLRDRGVVLPELAPLAHNQERSPGGSLGSPKLPTQNPPRCTSAPPDRLSLALPRPSAAPHEEPSPPPCNPRVSVPSSPAQLGFDTTLDPKRGEPCGQAESGSRLRRLSPRPTLALPSAQSTAPPLPAHDRSDDNGNSQPVPAFCQPDTTAKLDCDGSVLDAPLLLAGPSTVCEPPVGLHTETAPPPLNDAIRSDDGDCNSALGPPAVVPPPRSDQVLRPPPAPTERDLSRPTRGANAESQVVDRLKSDLRLSYRRAEIPETVLDVVLTAYKHDTLARYAYAYARLLKEASLSSLTNAASEQLITLINDAYSVDCADRSYIAKERYAVVALFPSHSPLLKHERLRHWRGLVLKTVPRHTHFFDLDQIFQDESAKAFDWADEDVVRSRLALCLSVFRLARAHDTCHISRDIQFDTDLKTMHTVWTRKGWHRPQAVCFFDNPNRTFSIPHLTKKYLDLQASDVARLEPAARPHFLFVSLSSYRNGRRSDLSADRVRNLRKKLLEAHGIDLKVFSSHSFRGAAVRLLDEYGVKPRTICKLGDWDSYNTFLAYYYRLRASQNLGDTIVPPARSLPALLNAAQTAEFLPDTTTSAATNSYTQATNRLAAEKVSVCPNSVGLSHISLPEENVGLDASHSTGNRGTGSLRTCSDVSGRKEAARPQFDEGSDTRPPKPKKSAAKPKPTRTTTGSAPSCAPAASPPSRAPSQTVLQRAVAARQAQRTTPTRARARSPSSPPRPSAAELSAAVPARKRALSGGNSSSLPLRAHSNVRSSEFWKPAGSLTPTMPPPKRRVA